jgi:hypothetical protein
LRSFQIVSLVALSPNAALLVSSGILFKIGAIFWVHSIVFLITAASFLGSCSSVSFCTISCIKFLAFLNWIWADCRWISVSLIYSLALCSIGFMVFAP